MFSGPPRPSTLLCSLLLLFPALAARPGSVQQGLVLHLPLDGDVGDTTGQGVSPLIEGKPTVGPPSVIGTGSLHFSSYPTPADVPAGGSQFNYLSLDDDPRAVLYFGQSLDFAVAFWVRLGIVTGSPPLVSSTDWLTPDNVGWTIATDSDQRLVWSYREYGNDAPAHGYTSPAHVLGGGIWHHVAVSFTRAGEAVTYVDGVTLDRQTLAQYDENGEVLPGSLYSGYATVIGQDGTGVYTGAGKAGLVDAAIDDVGIWQRGLNDDEVSRIVQFGRLGYDLDRVADSLQPYVVLTTPVDGDGNSNPAGSFLAEILDSVSSLNPASVKLYFDNVPVAAQVTYADDGGHQVSYQPAQILAPNSAHAYTLLYADDAMPPAVLSFTVFFNIGSYEDHVLPEPLFLETFDGPPGSVPVEGNLPDGWWVENHSQAFTGTADLDDPNSDIYMDWVVINQERALTMFGHTLGNVRNWQVVNGRVITNLIDGQFCFANSHNRAGSVYQILYSPDISVAGHSNIFLSFQSIYTQNQDSIGSVEYSIDGGNTWLPVVYMLDGTPSGDVVYDEAGFIDGDTTLAKPHLDAARYVDPGTGDTTDGHYGSFIGSTPDQYYLLGPYISGRINDDQVESKRVEFYRLPLADGQSSVRLRFAHSGTDSWYFGIDNVGLYSLDLPRPELQITPAADAVYLQWNHGGTLQAAEDLSGPWLDVMAADNLFRFPTTAPMQFHRVVRP
jgi:hypothetical protein